MKVRGLFTKTRGKSTTTTSLYYLIKCFTLKRIKHKIRDREQTCTKNERLQHYAKFDPNLRNCSLHAAFHVDEPTKT